MTLFIRKQESPSSEIQVMTALLAQNLTLSGGHPEKLLLDAGYFHDDVIAEVQKHQSLLFYAENSDRQSARKIYPKSLFTYDAEQDCYICPAHPPLSLQSTVKATEKTRAYRVYSADNCAGCPQKTGCTKARFRRHEIFSQRTRQRICTAARKDALFFAYRVAIPRQRLR
ncbi:hypothetical protein ACSLVK_10280 [Photorhabdus tasmaniensis]|uniref:hypothetical protein n=1 Tax=Photorhabdus tasmaniensis TaxID=1004159 RepID=UPI0040436DB8